MMIASLPMYDLPELRTATDAWWLGMATALRRAGIEGVPRQLIRVGNVTTVWRDPNLLLSQTCGYPLTHELVDVLRPVVTPIYDAPGCDGPNYCSAIVVSDEQTANQILELRGTICAVNHPGSQSGYNCLRALIAPLAEGRPFFSKVVESGSHGQSLEMVARGEADVCAMDCVTHALLTRHRPQALVHTKVLGYTSPAPGLPYATQSTASQDLLVRLREGIIAAFADPKLASARETLLLAGAEVLEMENYHDIPSMEAAAREQGYDKLH